MMFTRVQKTEAKFNFSYAFVRIFLVIFPDSFKHASSLACFSGDVVSSKPVNRKLLWVLISLYLNDI